MKTEKKRSFKGAVLFTVVSVMSLLIVFLTSTLVLATAANNRAQKSYSSSQANYTARAAIDGILAAIGQDEDFAQSVGAVSSTNSTLTVNVELDSSVSGMGSVQSAVVKYEGSQKFFDSEKNKWIDKDLLSVSAEVLYAGETKTVTAYLLKNPPENVNSSSGGGGFVTVGSASLGNHTNSFGGTYLGIGMEKGKRFYTGVTHPILGDVTLDQRLYLNVPEGTALETLPNGKEGYNVYNDIGRAFGTTIPTFSPQNNQTFEAPTVINGNFYIGNHSQLIIPTKSTGMAIWGNMTISNSFDISSSNVNVTDNFSRNPGESDEEYNARKNRAVQQFNEIPYIYVDGELSLNEGITLGKDYLPLNIFVGRFRQYTNNPSSIFADIYCQDENETSVLTGNGGGTKLYKFSDSVINQTEDLPYDISGNFCSKGSVQVEGIVKIEGDLLVDRDLTIKNGAKLDVSGDVIVGGTLNCDGEMNVTGYIAADSAMGSKITSVTGAKKMTADNSQELYEEHTETYNAVLVKNVAINRGGWSQGIPYAWLNKDAITEYGIPDSDGDGIIDNNVYDFGYGTTVNPDFVIQEMWSLGEDENTVTMTYDEITWINRDDGSVTKNENDTYEVSGYSYNNSKTIDPTSLYKSMHDGVIYPRKAEKTVILGFEEIGDGTPASDSKIIRTVDEIETDYNFGTSAITEIPADSSDPTKLKTDAQIITDSFGGSSIRVTGDCTLKGNFSGKDIIIEATSSDTWVKLDSSFNMSNGSRIVYDDTTGSGELKIFVEGQVSMNGNGCAIITKTYDEALFHSSDTYQINIYDNVNKISGAKELECPRITIYSRKPAEGETSPSIQINNMGIVTASIEAPYMKFGIQDVARFTANNIYYNGQDLLDLSDRGNRRIGVIGTLNVGELVSAGNNWDFLYVPRSNSGGGMIIKPTGADDLKFVVTYYEGF